MKYENKNLDTYLRNTGYLSKNILITCRTLE